MSKEKSNVVHIAYRCPSAQLFCHRFHIDSDSGHSSPPSDWCEVFRIADLVLQ